MTILDRILETKRVELEESRKLRPLDEVAAAAMQASPAISLAASVGQEGIRVVAEVKQASPSKGLIREAFDPEHLCTPTKIFPTPSFCVESNPKARGYDRVEFE